MTSRAPFQPSHSMLQKYDTFFQLLLDFSDVAYLVDMHMVDFSGVFFLFSCVFCFFVRDS